MQFGIQTKPVTLTSPKLRPQATYHFTTSSYTLTESPSTFQFYYQQLSISTNLHSEMDFSTRRTPSYAHHAYSTRTNSPYPTPHTPATRHGGMRAIRQPTPDSEPPTTHNPAPQAANLPSYYTLPPTVPSPFTGSLETSLDAILTFGTLHPSIQPIIDTLLHPVCLTTNWPLLLTTFLASSANNPRSVVEDLLFLVTRTLLPEQIAENRALMARLYERRKQLAIRLMLRYDMLTEWKAGMVVHTVGPPAGQVEEEDGDVEMVDAEEIQSWRRALMPNVWATLIAAPEGGYNTLAVRERMKHHVTVLDGYLMLEDGEVAAWKEGKVVSVVSRVCLVWQWLRRNTEMLEDMEVDGWEDLDGRAEECEWIADEVKKPVRRVKERKIRGGSEEDD